MNTTTIIILAAIALFVTWIVISRRKMKNVNQVKTSQKIRVLNQKTFKNQTRKGLVLVDFWAPWCKPCQVMAPVLNDVADAVDDDITVAKLNIDQNKQVASKNKVRSIPTLVLYRDGEEIDRFVGVKSKRFILNQLRKAQ